MEVLLSQLVHRFINNQTNNAEYFFSVRGKKRRRSGLRRGFLSCAIGEIGKVIWCSYFEIGVLAVWQRESTTCREILRMYVEGFGIVTKSRYNI